LRGARIGDGSRGFAPHRVTAGCVVVPAALYESVVMRGLGHRRGALCGLPATEPVGAAFAGIDRDL
jgi:hypothetical protein